MKKIITVGLAAAVYLLGSSAVFAAADSQYPAADFQPKVVFIDKEAAQSTASSSSASTCVPQQVQAKQTEFDPKFPAASFQPKVVYP